MPVLFLQMLIIFLQGFPLVKLAPPFHLSSICTKLVFSLLIQSHTHQWKVSNNACFPAVWWDLNFWRILWCVFALSAVCYVLLCVTGAIWMSWWCHDVILSFWVFMAWQKGLHASMSGQYGQALFLDSELPLGRIYDNLNPASACFLQSRMCSIAKA